jgi:hypothetical protein
MTANEILKAHAEEIKKAQPYLDKSVVVSCEVEGCDNRFYPVIAGQVMCVDCASAFEADQEA